ncbi:MAG: MOSC domain-containing protein [Myxococcales bacterium]|nr:MOSC domain-containing protein [Myxococcales bacterium]|tara:strand:+ start:861 stop:1658 length:798 start_codon:yes stop_codon:yes gene_type:complete
MTEITVDELAYYPLKSGRSLTTQSAYVTPKGLLNDRRWMVVDSHGRFLTARTHPQLLRITARPKADGSLELQNGSERPMRAKPRYPQATIDVEIWGCQTKGARFEASIDQWLSDITGLECHLVYMPQDVVRPIKSSPQDEVSYADGYPLLLTNQSSLADLNTRLMEPVSMDAFRPNVVIKGADAFAERHWEHVTIGSVSFKSGGECVRCAMTVLDPKTGQKRTDGEPLKSLAGYQRTAQGVIFGVNLIPVSDGEIRVGDPVRLLD